MRQQRIVLIIEALRAWRFSKLLLLYLLALSVTACGTVPRAKVTYYQTNTKVYFKVTQSFYCDEADNPISTASAVPTVVHSADYSKPPYPSVDLEKLKKIFTNTDIKFDFYDDGRLKSINSTVSGQGETIIKAATTLLSSIVPLSGDQPINFKQECAFIKKAGDGKPISITYSGEAIPTAGKISYLSVDESSSFYANKLKDLTQGICVVVPTEIIQPQQPFEYNAKNSDVLITGRQPALVNFAVGQVINGGCADDIWIGKISVAQLGTEFVLPVPHSVLFGKVSLSASFEQSGSISSLQYVAGDGATASALNSIATFATYAKGKTLTTAEEAAEVKSEADLIMQQQRLLSCRVKPTECK